MGVVDDIVNRSWDMMIQEDSTVIGKVLGIITELERILGVRQLFQKSELNVLENMIEKTPQSVVKRHQFKQLILRLVGFQDFEAFLLKRFKLTHGDLLKIDLKPREQYPRVEPIRPSKYNSYASDTFELKKLYEDNKFLEIQLHDKNIEINDLKRQLEIANNYSMQLESTIKQNSSPNDLLPTNSIENLKKIRQQNSIIELLEQQNNIYQQELQNFIEKDKQNEIKFTQIANQIKQSNKLTTTIQDKLNLNDDNVGSNFQKLLKNLPFIKQYYYYYNYKQQNQNWGIIIINIFTLLFSLIFVLNFVQLAWYLMIKFFTSQSTLSEYTYDSYEPGWFEVPMWKNNLIEGWIWELEDWLRI